MSCNNKPIALGTGFIALDIVFSPDDANRPVVAAGGSCGNVLAVLKHLGWETFPIARLNGDPAAQRIRSEYRQLGIRLDFASLGPCAPTPVIFQEFSLEFAAVRTHTFSSHCPSCGSRSPRFQPVAEWALGEILESLPTASACYLDRANVSSLMLAESSARSGAVVVFEPSTLGDEECFRRIVQLATIVKYSHERFSSIDEYLDDVPILEIQTLGKHGLRFRSRLPHWQALHWESMPAFSMVNVVDASGAGDWSTAGLLSHVASEGAGAMLRRDGVQMREALRFGQALGALNCGYMGARGLMGALSGQEIIAAASQLIQGAAVPYHADRELTLLEDVWQTTPGPCTYCHGIASA